MKKLLVLFVMMSAATISKAQIEKGTILLGGGAAFTSAEGESSFFINPNVGFFVVNRIAVGVNASLFTAGGSTTWSFGPFGRYYFGNNESGKPFGGLGFGLSGFDGGDTNFGVGLTAGYAIFLNRSIALELAAHYDRISDFDQLSIGAGFQIHFKQ